jgi:hypothetical protein
MTREAFIPFQTVALTARDPTKNQRTGGTSQGEHYDR